MLRPHRQRLEKYTRARGFTLVELLVALAVFATMAAMAWGGLDSIARTRSSLAAEQDDLRGLMHAFGLLERDLRAAVARPVRGNYGEIVPALIGGSDKLEFTRLGFANPEHEQRSNLQRVAYALNGAKLVRGSYAVLDRAPNTAAAMSSLRDHVVALRLRYFDAQQRWLAAWPAPPDDGGTVQALPRAIEMRLEVQGYGEITRTIELVSDFPRDFPRESTGAAP
jgi:general secretion pathway protein J